MPEPAPIFWNLPAGALLAQLQSQPEGLAAEEARTRRARYAGLRLKPNRDIRPLVLLLAGGYRTTAAGEIRYGDFAQLVRWHLGNGVDGICVAGDNGESWTLSLDERRRLETQRLPTAGRQHQHAVAPGEHGVHGFALQRAKARKPPDAMDRVEEGGIGRGRAIGDQAFLA